MSDDDVFGGEEPPIPREAIEAAIRHAQQAEARRRSLERRGIYVNYVQPVQHAGKKFWALGTSVWYSDNPQETFHQFIIRVLIATMGDEWWREQQALPEEEEHIIVACAQAYERWIEEHHGDAEEVRPGVWRTDPDGGSLYLLSFAFDIASLVHAMKLPPKLLDRLRHRDQFQGARYEVAVAAMFALIDCEIEWLPDAASSKHPEFVAVFRPNVARVAVEAKSRHRPGVVHLRGDFDEDKSARGDVAPLLARALEQNPGGIAFVICVDANAPLTPDVPLEEKEWYATWCRSWTSTGSRRPATQTRSAPSASRTSPTTTRWEPELRLPST